MIGSLSPPAIGSPHGVEHAHRRHAVTTAVSLVPIACGGDAADARQADQQRLHVQRDTSPTAGMFTIEVENQTEFSGSFVLLSLAEGWTVDDLQPAPDQYPRQFERKGHFQGRRTTDSWSAPTSRPERPGCPLPTSPPAIRPRVLCRRRPSHEKVYIAGQLDVTK